MVPSPVCDFCGLSRVVLSYPSLADQPGIELDEDCLWVCSACKARLISQPVGPDALENTELDEKIAARIGKSAGAICRTLNLPYVPPYQSIIDYTTVWQSEDRTTEAFVSPDGTIQLYPRR